MILSSTDRSPPPPRTYLGLDDDARAAPLVEAAPAEGLEGEEGDVAARVRVVFVCVW